MECIKVHDEQYRFVIIIDVTSSMGNWFTPCQDIMENIIYVASISNTFTEFAILAYTDYDQKIPVVFSGWYNVNNYNGLITFIKDQKPRGGGDIEEAVKTAIYELLKHCDKDINTLVLHYTDAPAHFSKENRTECTREKEALGDRFSWITMTEEVLKYKITYSCISTYKYSPYSYLSMFTNGSFHHMKNTNELQSLSISILNGWFGLNTIPFDVEIGNFDHIDVDENKILDVFCETKQSNITIPYFANRIKNVYAMFTKNESFREIVFETFKNIIAKNLLLLCINKIYGRLWRCFLQGKLDERTIQLERLSQLAYNNLSAINKNIFDTWNLESYDASSTIDQQISDFIAENGIHNVITYIPDLNDYRDARDIMSVFRSCTIKDQNYITSAFLRMSNVHLRYEPIQCIDDLSNLKMLPENSLPFNLKNKDFFDLILSIVSKGAKINSVRHRFILALLARKCGCIFKQRAHAILVKLKCYREELTEKGKPTFLTWDLNENGDTIIGENYCISFLYLLQENSDILLESEIVRIKQLLQVGLAMRLSNMELPVKIFDEKSMDGIYPNNLIKCISCKYFVPDTIISGSGKCGYCCHSKKATLNASYSTVRCTTCTRFYARLPATSEFCSMKNKCYYCRIQSKSIMNISLEISIFNINNNVDSTWTCKCCNLTFTGSTFKDDYLCGVCTSNQIKGTNIVRLPTFSEYNDNTLVKLLDYNMQPVYHSIGLLTSLKNTVSCKMYKIFTNFTFTVPEIVPVPIMKYIKNGGDSSTAITIANNEEVWNIVLRAIETHYYEKNICEFCSDNKASNDLMPICGRNKCTSRVCYDCGKNWYGDIVKGKLVNSRHLTCPMCDRKPTCQVIGRWNAQLLTINSSIVYDSKKYYAWCITCSNVVEHSMKACNETIPFVSDYECSDCQFAKLNLAELDNLEKAQEIFGKTMDCPNCKLSINKISGCNHIACPCGQHFCFKCGEGFHSSSDTYDHMSKAHGAWYDNGERPVYYNDGYDSDN